VVAGFSSRHRRLREFDPKNIRFTSECVGFEGFRALVREMPHEHEAGTGQSGLPTQLAGRPELSPSGCRSIRSNDIGGWMPRDHSDLPFTLGLAKHIGYADGF
jgi:hypothetical protein